MPLYEYRCRKCGAQFENIQKFSDPILTKCKQCGGELERLLSSPAIQFKGTGWYVTDYAKKSSDGGEKKTEPPAVLESKSETKADSKSEAKAETKTESKSDSRSDSKKSETKSATKPAPAASSDK